MTSLPAWLEPQWQRLQESAQRGRLSHAILLSGPAGVGKSILLTALEELVICSQREVPPCGNCRSCLIAAAGNHPDYHLLEAPEDKSTIGVDQVRDLVSKLSFTSSFGNRKVGVVRPAEIMTPGAANALLKTLEEPPGDTVLILLSHEAWRLPATIISRCQTIYCGVPQPAEAAKWLHEVTGEGDWEVCIDLAGGAPLQAIKYKKQNVSELFESTIEDVISLKNAHGDLVAIANSWVDEQLPVRLISLYSALRLVALQHSGVEGELAHKSAVRSLHNAVQDIKLSALLGYQIRILRTRALLDKPLNRQLMLEGLLAPWANGFSQYELESLEQ